MGTKSLIAFDTDHIKSFVFGTERLKEIRGASSLLDYLNRVETVRIANEKDPQAEKIYANGGSALFLVATEKAEQLGQAVQKCYRERTGGGASITYAIQPLPAKYDTYDTQKTMTDEMPDVLELLNRRLQIAKDRANHSGRIALPSHPFLTPCSSCGVVYAEEAQPDPDDPENPDNRYCRVCLEKRWEDHKIKDDIRGIMLNAAKDRFSNSTLWGRILGVLKEQTYDFSAKPKRPKDFNIFGEFAQGKEYVGLIYADANGMGNAREEQTSLQKLKDFAEKVDNAVFNAMGQAIKKHLPVQNNLFPFDILLIGGDDIVIVVPAAKALHIAHTLANEFHTQTHNKYTLSVGVVLAPVKYPFYLQRALAEEILKAAKKVGSSAAKKPNASIPAYINFMVVTGGTSLTYKDIYQDLHRKKLPHSSNPDEFYATLRPYTLDQLATLLDDLKQGNRVRLGRTKLHQLREAILKRNRTTTILEALASLRNWKHTEREFIEGLVDTWGKRSPQQRRTETLFPWYRESGTEHIYRTPLLDFIELYDFVVAEEVKNR